MSEYMKGDVAYEITCLIFDGGRSPFRFLVISDLIAFEYFKLGSATGPELGRFQPTSLPILIFESCKPRADR